MSLNNDITELESVLSNCVEDHTCEELASMEERLFNLNRIKDLWSEFGDVPMNPCLEIIEQSWHGFPAGTHRETIWHWFEDEFGISVAEDLMYEDEKPSIDRNSNLHLELFLREEIKKAGLEGTAEQVAFVTSEVTADERAMTIFYATIDDAINKIKTSSIDYSVEIYDSESDKFIGQLDYVDNLEDALNIESQYEQSSDYDSSTECVRIYKIERNDNGDEISRTLI